jgi:hypothetical protein
LADLRTGPNRAGGGHRPAGRQRWQVALALNNLGEICRDAAMS